MAFLPQTAPREGSVVLRTTGCEVPAREREATERWQGGGTLESIRADQITMRAIHWLWGKRFAVGKIGIIAGLPDEGKGQILCYLAARCTRGLEWPNSEGISPRGNVVILSAEENPGDSLAPRLEAAGADLSRIHFINMVRDATQKPASRGSACSA